MKKIIRVGLLIVMVVLGFTVVFPEWFDLKDQVVVERQEEQAEAERQQQDAKNKQQYETEAAALNALQPQAEALQKKSGAPWMRGTISRRSIAELRVFDQPKRRQMSRGF